MEVLEKVLNVAHALAELTEHLIEEVTHHELPVSYEGAAKYAAFRNASEGLDYVAKIRTVIETSKELKKQGVKEVQFNSATGSMEIQRADLQ